MTFSIHFGRNEGGEIVIIDFPFSDKSGSKCRPAHKPTA